MPTPTALGDAVVTLNLPENAGQFVDSIKTDRRQLIQLGLWDIQVARFESWLKQFCGEEEEFFAACLLDQLTFRTSRQFEASIRALFRGTLNSSIRPGKPDMELSRILTEQAEPGIRLIPVIGDSDPPTKSGPLVLRRLQRLLRIRTQWMCWPWQANKHASKSAVTQIVFVDDFLGSGRQFVDFFNAWSFADLAEKVGFTYAPIVAHQEGIQNINEKLPFVKVVSAEKLTASHNFFSEDVWNRLGQGRISAGAAKEWYESFVAERGLTPKSMSALGVGELSLTFGFSHSTPNNSLPILWYESPRGWQPLLER